MFREMRRKRQMLSQDDSVAILERMTFGVLGVSGDEGYPYAVPLSYVYADGRIWFHCALSGHKVDAIKRNDKVSFCVVEQDHVVPKEFTTYFRSVIAFGRVRILTDESEKRQALERLAQKYAPNESDDSLQAEIEKGGHRLFVVEIEIEHLTGKQAIELVPR